MKLTIMEGVVAILVCFIIIFTILGKNIVLSIPLSSLIPKLTYQKIENTSILKEKIDSREISKIALNTFYGPQILNLANLIIFRDTKYLIK